MSDNIRRLADAQARKKEREKPQRDELIELVLTEKVELFRSQEGDAYASFDEGSRLETYAIRSSGFKLRLTHLFYDRTGGAPSDQGMREAIAALEARARFRGEQRLVAVRVAEVEDSVFIDLGTDDWAVVEVSATGWRIITHPPLRFVRPGKLGPLPSPVRGGSLSELRQFVNCQDDATFQLLVAWGLAVLRPRFATPILVLQGEQGSAKSTTAKIMQALLDPGIPDLRSAPKNEQDLIVAARSRRLLCFDNLSGIPEWLSDASCRLCTGGGYGTRQLFTDSEEIVFEGTRAILFTGIDDLARRNDLADRALLLVLSPISEEQRQGEDLLMRFEEAKGRIFGAMLDALAVGLRRMPLVMLKRAPRMADFARWGAACEPVLGLTEGGFAAIYGGNRSEAAERSLEDDVVAVAVRDFMAERHLWEGGAKELLELLNQQASDSLKSSRAWPRAPNRLSGRLTRAAPVLRAAGISIENGKVGQGASRRRSIRLTKASLATDPTVPIDPQSSGEAANRAPDEAPGPGPVCAAASLWDDAPDDSGSNALSVREPGSDDGDDEDDSSGESSDG